MKTLFYNPIERPKKVHIVSKIFDIDKTYDGDNTELKLFMDELFKMAELDCFNEVKVFLTNNNEAYIRKHKLSFEKKEITGWLSLKNIKNGGGYLKDKVLIIEKNNTK